MSRKKTRKSPKAIIHTPPREEFSSGSAALNFKYGNIQCLLLAGFYLLSRLTKITSPGLHYDETTYLYWGQVISQDWSQRYIGAGWGGKQPLHAWLVALSEIVFPDPVFAGRFVSILAGGFTLLAVWLLAKHLWNSKVAFLAGLLYVLSPFTLIFDRLALIDSLLAAETMWIIYLSVLLVSRQNRWVIIGLAMSLGMALLTKSISKGFILLLPAALLIPAQIDQRIFKRWFISIAPSLAGGFVIYYLFFGISNASQLISQFDQQYGRYTIPISDLLQFPWQTWKDNMLSVARWFTTFSTWSLALAAIAALLVSPRLGRPAWFLCMWILLPTLGQIIIANRFYDRYILFSIPPLLILTAHFLDRCYRWFLSQSWIAHRDVLRWPASTIVATIILTGLLIPPILRNYHLLTDPPFSNPDTHGWYGLYYARDYLNEQAKIQPVYLIVNYSPSPVEDGLAVLLHRNVNIQVLRIAPMNDKLTIFDPLSREIFPKEYFTGKVVAYANRQDAETESWLAGKIELIRSFPNFDGDSGQVSLYNINFDDTFQ